MYRRRHAAAWKPRPRASWRHVSSGGEDPVAPDLQPSAGARLLQLHPRSNLGGDAAAAAAAADRRFGFFGRDHRLHTAMAIAALSTVGAGIWYMSKDVDHADKEECGNEISKSASKAFDGFSCLNEAEHADTQKGEAKEELRIKQFKEWMDEYSIQYPDEETRQHRFSIFKANVELHGNTYPEYRAALDSACYEDLVRSLRPSKIDWVEAGVVSPVVRKQNGCGCCWAMATVGSVEAVHHIKTKQSIMLSVQELIDCNTKNNGCKGGHSHYALKYIKKNGLSTESSYPYIHQTSISGCKRSKTAAAAARISGFKHVDRTEDSLEEAVAKQPVVVILQSSSGLKSYKGGIMEYEALPYTLPDGASKTRRHAVLIVGYGTDPNGVRYWRFKNSWGKGWGEGGFGRIRRHVADERGALGMFMWPAIYPVLLIDVG